MSHIEQTSPEARVAEVAVHALGSRLGDVLRVLPLAARHADDDIEYVHELRVASRRAVATMGIFAELLPKRRARRMTKVLEEIRRAAGTARDIDVLMARWRSDAGAISSLQRHIERRRRRAQEPLVAIDERLSRTGRLARKISKLLATAASKMSRDDDDDSPRFGVWSRHALAARIDAFFVGAGTSSQDQAALHRFRISGKDLRYAMEVLAGAFPAELSNDLYPVVELLQGKTGKITDHADACRRLEKRLAKHRSRREAGAAAHMLEAERARLNEATQAFHDWWSPERSGELQRRLLSLSALTPA